MQALKLPLLIQTHLRESARIKNETANRCAPEIEVAIALISDSFAAGGKLLLCVTGVVPGTVNI